MTCVRKKLSYPFLAWALLFFGCKLTASDASATASVNQMSLEVDKITFR